MSKVTKDDLCCFILYEYLQGFQRFQLDWLIVWPPGCRLRPVWGGARICLVLIEKWGGRGRVWSIGSRGMYVGDLDGVRVKIIRPFSFFFPFLLILLGLGRRTDFCRLSHLFFTPHSPHYPLPVLSRTNRGRASRCCGVDGGWIGRSRSWPDTYPLARAPTAVPGRQH